MNNQLHKRQMIKFGLYGFLKNLKFYEPYLILYFTLVSGLSLLQVGILYSVREVIIYLFEIPSGVLADKYGKKNELILCFLFYILSFILFYIGGTFSVFIFAMGLFGLGEAFRSGTHKAMIMQYLDHTEIETSKTKIYGTTRSMSMIGSMTMSLVSVLLIIIFNDLSLEYLKYLFLLSVIPYLFDLILVVGYPSYMNDREVNKFKWKEFLKSNLESIRYVWQDHNLRSLLFEDASYQAGFKSIKDYIQPIVLMIPMGYLLLNGYSSEQHASIYLGLIYAVVYLVSAISSKYSYLLAHQKNPLKLVQITWMLSGIFMLILSVYMQSIGVVFLVFMIFYVLLNLRKPLLVDMIGEASIPSKRASVLSVESQLVSLLIAIFAPILGWIADQSMSLLFFGVGIVMISIYFKNSLLSMLSPK